MTGIAEAKNIYVVGAKILGNKKVWSFMSQNLESIKSNSKNLVIGEIAEVRFIYLYPACIPPVQSCL